MALTKYTASTAIIAALSDLPNATDGLTAAQLKAKFDENPEAFKTFVNALIDQLEATTDGSSGADQIGATSITDLTGNTVQALLESLKDLVDTQLPTPDGSITNTKLATDVKVGSLAALTTTDKSSVVAAVNEHLADDVKHITSTERSKWDGGQLYKLTESNGGTILLANGTSLDNILTSGFYRLGAPPELPAGTYVVEVTRTNSGDGIITQLIHHTNTSFGKLLYRIRDISSVWSPFREIIQSDTIMKGAGSPEGVLTAIIGALYLREDGTTGTTFYVKETGTGNTGWTAK